MYWETNEILKILSYIGYIQICYYKLLENKLWGVLKGDVYAQNPRTLRELKDEIENTCRNISEVTIENVCRSVMRRYERCITVRGAHFEHI